MENLFFEYLTFKNKNYKDILNECIFVFDTNVLLNFYRYSEGTIEDLKQAILHYQDRIWIPHQVGQEYFQNRINTIIEQKRNYEEPRKSLNKIKDMLNNKKGHPFINNDLLEKFNNIFIEFDKEFKIQENNLSNLIKEDLILESILKVFHNKVGNPYSKEELVKIYNEGRERYKSSIPPGYKDISKPEPNRYGDLIIWKQMIDKSNSEKKSIVFITDEEKSDWIEIQSSQYRETSPQLIREFHEKTSNFFYIYKPLKFLEYAASSRSTKLKQSTIDEVKTKTISSNENQNFPTFNIYKVELLLDWPQENSDIIDRFRKTIENLGYQFTINKIDNSIYLITSTVSFEDLVRRFQNHISHFASEYGYQVASSSYIRSSV